ncbi:Flagellar hook-associated protein FlgK [hydrothermal vent metagenome]|uniref:Flagellar hook-associated protein FlgK n=1 Tax=hydrothermal vent metagenome TaxID=652676 RepID=A0A3B0QZP7_9ZZZZ
MSEITSLMSIARTALMSTQKSISVVSHNIANANTEGYSKQRTLLETRAPAEVGGLLFGRGVDIADISRIYDPFIEASLRDAKSDFSFFDSKGAVLSNVESIINDLATEFGLSFSINDFFNGFQDVANDPSSATERGSLLAKASVMADTLQRIDQRVKQELTSIGGQVDALVVEVNSLANRIADVNKEIIFMSNRNLTPNDLLDKRDSLLRDLSEIIDISTFKDNEGTVNVLMGTGIKLVSGTQVTKVTLVEPSLTTGSYELLSGGVVKFASRLTGGSIKGLIDGRDQAISTLKQIDVLAASIYQDVNGLHSAGYGLDNSTGNDFFTGIQVYTEAESDNTGGARVSASSITSLSALTLDDYQITFSAPATYNVVNSKTGSVVVSAGAYTSGNAIAFEGISVTITNNTGAPAVGDTFDISATHGLTGNIDIAITDTDKVAASSTLAGLPGNNINALAMSALRDAKNTVGKTYADYHTGILTEVGVESNFLNVNLELQESVVQELTNSRESVSGVSLEEEAIEMIKLQRSFEAAAKLLTVADEMFQTILSIKR